METFTAHVDDLGDIEVKLVDESAPCPECGTPGHETGWRILTVATYRGRRIDVFRCPTCSTACGMTE